MDELATSRDDLGARDDAVEQWIERINADSPTPMLAGLICMAMDGYNFERILGLNLCDDEGREQLKAYMLELLTSDGARK